MQISPSRRAIKYRPIYLSLEMTHCWIYVARSTANWIREKPIRLGQKIRRKLINGTNPW